MSESPYTVTTTYQDPSEVTHNNMPGYVIPSCGTVAITVILDPVSDGNGGWYSDLKAGGLHTHYPSIYPLTMHWAGGQGGHTQSAVWSSYVASSSFTFILLDSNY